MSHTRAARGPDRRTRGDRGAAAVEFALVLVLLLTLVFGILQYGLYFWSLQSGSHAAREAARQAAVGTLTCTEFRTAVLANSQGENVSSVTARRTYYTTQAMTTEATPAVAGGVVKVNVSFSVVDLNLPFIPDINGGQVSETAVARVENVTSNSVKCP